MMVNVGNFLFRYRNGLFPLVYGVLLVDQSRMWNDDLVAALIGFIVAMTGQILRALAIGLVYVIRGGRNRHVYAEKLITQGMFAHSRNPLYLGNLLIITGVGIAANSIVFLAIGMPLFLVAYLCIIAAEEDYLSRNFGSEYVEYCNRVNRLIPDFTGFRDTIQGTKFIWKRFVSADYGTVFYWSAGMIGILGKNVWQHSGNSTGRLLISGLGFSLVILMIAYATARYMKKSGKLAH